MFSIREYLKIACIMPSYITPKAALLSEGIILRKNKKSFNSMAQQHFRSICITGVSYSYISCILDCTKFVCFDAPMQNSQIQRRERNSNFYQSNRFFEGIVDWMKIARQNTWKSENQDKTKDLRERQYFYMKKNFTIIVTYCKKDLLTRDILDKKNAQTQMKSCIFIEISKFFAFDYKNFKTHSNA